MQTRRGPFAVVTCLVAVALGASFFSKPPVGASGEDNPKAVAIVQPDPVPVATQTHLGVPVEALLVLRNTPASDDGRFRAVTLDGESPEDFRVPVDRALVITDIFYRLQKPAGSAALIRFHYAVPQTPGSTLVHEFWPRSYTVAGALGFDLISGSVHLTTGFSVPPGAELIVEAFGGTGAPPNTDRVSLQGYLVEVPPEPTTDGVIPR